VTARRCAGRRCDTTIADGFICHNCIVALRIELRDVPDLLANLDITRSRQDQLTGPYDSTRGTGDQPLPFKDVTEVAWILHNTLAAWATDLLGPAEALSTPDIARWLLLRTDTIRVHPDAGQCVEEMSHAIHHARHRIDRPDDRRQFLGPCGAQLSAGATCREELFGVPWKPTARCPACGAEHNTELRQHQLREIAQEHLGTAVEIAAFLRCVGVNCTSSMIRNYAARGRLTPAPDTQPPMYRIRDVLTTLQDRYRHKKTRKGASRASDKSRQAS